MPISTGERIGQIIPKGGCLTGRILCPGGSLFEYDLTQQPVYSSPRKRVFTGRYTEFFRGGFVSVTPARAVEFPVQFLESFGKECFSLASATAVGAGPKVFHIFHSPSPLAERLLQSKEGAEGEDGSADGKKTPKCEECKVRAIAIEEDVGIDLDSVLFKRAKIPDRAGVEMRTLSDVGTPEREIENAKIKFDVFAQLFNLHSNGIYHRDLRAANVCVRRYGERPEDIRATLIDLELASGLDGYDVPLVAEPYFKTLFKRDGDEGDEYLKVNPLEFDMGYLAAFCYELEREIRVAAADASLLDGSRYSFFANTGHGYLRVRSLQESDLVELAEKTNLRRVCVDELGSQEAVDLANRLVKHGGYLDKLDDAELLKEPLTYILMKRSDLVEASYETYKDEQIKNGRPIDYQSFYDQPKDLQELNLDLFARYPEKLERFGYALALKGRVPAGGTPIEDWTDLYEGDFEKMSADEHNRWWAMKEKQGWRPWVPELGEEFDKKKADAEKRNKYMVPYEKLDDRTKEYDRKNVRNMWRFLNDIGLEIYRP